MFSFLYSLVIFPVELVMETCFNAINRIFHNSVLSIFGVSAAVSLLTLPLFLVAEKWQNLERDTERRLKQKAEKIRAVFSGDERFMIISTYYRQNHYHPVYALRSSIGILIQIPFFIAAYSFLSGRGAVGEPFLFIASLGAPDAAFSIGGFTVNVLPVIMTLVNAVSGAIYTRGLPAREKAQIFGMAAVFLVLLYNAPAGLVLYWLMNNVFSLVKNILLKIKTRRRNVIMYGGLCAGALALTGYFLVSGFSPKRMFLVLLVSAVYFIPLFIKLAAFLKRKIAALSGAALPTAAEKRTFVLSALALFLLSGLVIPSSLIASSVQEFSFIEFYRSPYPFLGTVLVQSAGFFLLWPLGIYLLFSGRVKKYLALFASLAMIAALLDNFLFPGNFGFLTATFKFSAPDTLESQYGIIAASSLSALAVLPAALYLLLSRRKQIFHTLQLIVIFSLAGLSAINIININRDFNKYAEVRGDPSISGDETAPVYTFSSTGKNVLVIMLDRALSGFVPYIFNELDLYGSYDGFVWYPNCVSFGRHTRIGAPPLFGGYEYVPSLIQADRKTAMRRHNEALQMLPALFSGAGFSAVFTDPSFANYSLKPDLSIFSGRPEIHVENRVGALTGRWLREHPEIKVVSLSTLFTSHLVRFSFFKMAPPAFRIFLYDKGEWLAAETGTGGNLSLDTIDNYAALDVLPSITGFTGADINTYTALTNDITHSQAYLLPPDYTPSSAAADHGPGPFAEEDHYHVNAAAWRLLAKWFAYLKANHAYDNTRIIIASDHGVNVDSDYEGNITLPDGGRLAAYHSVLLFKDFGSQGRLAEDRSFMTAADVPLLAAAGLIENPVNPFTGIPLAENKEGGILAATPEATKYTIAEDEWLRVHGNIFDPENWEKATFRFGNTGQ